MQGSVMLSAGNDKLNATAKKLAEIKQCKEKLQQKLVKLEGPASSKDSKSKSVSDKPPVKRKKLTNRYTATGTQASELQEVTPLPI